MDHARVADARGSGHRVQSGHWLSVPPEPKGFHLRNTVVMVVLAIVAAVTWVASWQREEPATPAPAAADPRPLGYYLYGARLLGTDEQGRVAYRVLAQRIDELPDEGRLRFEGVSVEYQPVGETAWAISAANASGPKDGSQLDLAGNVEVRSAPTDGSRPESFSTQKLRFSPESSSAETDEPVTIHVGDWHLDAIGLRTHLKDDTLRLESQVHGTFAPQ